MKIYDMLQGSEDWFNARKGKFTASEFDTLFMKPSTKGYQNLINSKVYEIMTGEIPESFQGDWMNRGKELEPEARQAYEFLTFSKVNQVGFIELNEWVGCSPDGLIDEDGTIEIKCPKFSTLISYHLSDNPESDYVYQIQGQLWISQRKWCDYFVYHPKLKPLLKRIERDESVIKSIEGELHKAINLVQERLEKIK